MHNIKGSDIIADIKFDYNKLKFNQVEIDKIVAKITFDELLKISKKKEEK